LYALASVAGSERKEGMDYKCDSNGSNKREQN